MAASSFDSERRDVLRRFFSLSDQDQLDAFGEIREHLVADGVDDHPHDREIVGGYIRASKASGLYTGAVVWLARVGI